MYPSGERRVGFRLSEERDRAQLSYLGRFITFRPTSVGPGMIEAKEMIRDGLAQSATEELVHGKDPTIDRHVMGFVLSAAQREREIHVQSRTDVDPRREGESPDVEPDQDDIHSYFGGREALLEDGRELGLIK